MSDRRRYGDPCGVARALDVVGDRWALLIVRELLLGPKRYSDLARGLAGAGPTVLTQRLRDLEDGGVVQRTATPGVGRLYELTDRGMALDDVLRALGRWGARTEQTSTGALSADAFVLALRTIADPAALAGWTAVIELRVVEGETVDRIELMVAERALRATRRAAGAAAVAWEGELVAMRAVAFGRRSLSEALGDGDVRITGDAEVLHRLLGALVVPTPDVVAAPEVSSGNRPDHSARRKES